MQIHHFLKITYLTSLLTLLAICTTTHAQSSQTDRLKGAPFYKSYGKKVMVSDSAIRFVHVGLDQTTKTEFFYEGRERVLRPLAGAFAAYLDSLGFDSRLDSDKLPQKGAPYVYVGSAEGESAPEEAAMQRMEHDKYPPMVIHIDKPSKAWRQALKDLNQADAGAYVLWLTVGFAEYPKADKGMFGKKVVLGTNYERPIRFLSAEDKPVEVLQISGMLLDMYGKILRAGAEGLFHEDTPFWVQVLELKTEMRDETVSSILFEQRREDLPGQPLVWKVGLHNLLANLLQKSKITAK